MRGLRTAVVLGLLLAAGCHSIRYQRGFYMRPKPWFECSIKARVVQESVLSQYIDYRYILLYESCDA